MSDKTKGSVPFSEISNKDPASSHVGPDIVPLPSKSPIFRLQPVTVWCVICYGTLQYKYFVLLIVIS